MEDLPWLSRTRDEPYRPPVSSAVILQMGKLRCRDFHHQSVAKPGTKSWAGADALLGAGCNVGASQHGLSLRITQGKVAGRVIATVLEHPGCGYPSCCKWEREALDQLYLLQVTP